MEQGEWVAAASPRVLPAARSSLQEVPEVVPSGTLSVGTQRRDNLAVRVGPLAAEGTDMESLRHTEGSIVAPVQIPSDSFRPKASRGTEMVAEMKAQKSHSKMAVVAISLCRLRWQHWVRR